MQSTANDLKNLLQTDSFLAENSRRKINSVAYGLVSGAKTNLISSLDKFTVIVTSDPINASKLETDLKAYGKNPVVLPAKEEVLLYNKALSTELTHMRCNALYRLISNNCDTLILTIDGLYCLYPHAERFAQGIINIKSGAQYTLGALIKRLIFAGYKRENNAELAGQFALRGDILDIFPVNYINPVRIEFFGDEAERITIFDKDTGKSFKTLNAIAVSPATDVFIFEEEIPKIVKNIENSAKYADNLATDYAIRLRSIAADLISRLQMGAREPSLGYILPLTDSTGSLRHYLPADINVILDEEKLISDKARVLFSEHDSRFTSLLSMGEVFKESYKQFTLKSEIFKLFENDTFIGFNLVGQTIYTNAKAEKTYNTSSVRRYSLNFKELAKDMSNWLFSGYKIVVCGATNEATIEAYDKLKSNDIPCVICDEVSFKLESKSVQIIKCSISEGFISHTGKTVVIASTEIQPKGKAKSIRRRKKDVFLTPNIGDFIVHEIHGIGVCKGIKNLSMGVGDKNYGKDYIVIEYKDKDTLYVPCDQMDLITKYAGSDADPRLNRLGGKEFEKLKAKVKRQIKEMAFDLKDLYARRQAEGGFAFEEDSNLQKEFEDAFEHEETEDQIRSIAEIKADMESKRVMDRLLCGDVGFGKTEVALRAIFKAVMSGKQVVFLAPTTILSRQHYELCIKRLGEFGVRVDILNRFRTTQQQKLTLQNIKEGTADVVVGTHRLLSKDIVFKDLGLLVVDEEQRFGVEDKERIKNLKSMVDVLTLSATPIPRTLHMSLSGIRDISVLDTPPKQRLPVQTYVLEYSEALIRDAVMRELSRGGQSYILYNKVESIDVFSHKVRQLVPEARVITAHGQMAEDSLEKAIDAFYSGASDVLVCSTIIENGIDVPKANTLIVYEADRLGLSQLYQLRGRVGRSNRLAHVYFTYKPEKILTESAYKRLKAIMEFTELGSGFKIAMRDLEIRGAGNVLGKKQHGHLENVGYDMYCRLLRQSVKELGGAEEDLFEYVDMDIEADSYIPEKYIEDSSNRMKAYQKIAGMEEYSEYNEIYEELADIYGAVPQPVINLLNIAAIKVLAKKLKAEKVSVKNNVAEILLGSMEFLKQDKLLNAIEADSKMCALSFGEKPSVIIKPKSRKAELVLEQVLEFLLKAV